MKIWLDDLHFFPGTDKSTPEGWTGVGSLEELVAIIEAPEFSCIDEMSFDQDLGEGKPTGTMTMELLARKAEEQRDARYWPKMVLVHTTLADWRIHMISLAQKTKAKLRDLIPTPVAT